MTIFFVCKWLTWSRRSCRNTSGWKAIAYWLFWPGMDADAFLDSRVPALRVSNLEWLLAVAKFMTGLMLMVVATNGSPTGSPVWNGWLGMVGIVMVLHFGLFHLLSCTWRSIGIAARPLMRVPFVSSSLAEFWGRRWNTAFRDLTYHFLYRPLAARLGTRIAMMLGFLLSGFIHELAITVPARGGYGGPTLFFLIQGCGLWLERSERGKCFGLSVGWTGWIFTLVCLSVPLPLLFPPPFVCQVILPFLQQLRTWS